ncbi:tetratricopeptide repeat protein [Geminocystis sp. NIES-3709]|uniref:tetratricopeptide repeat protein n=1 Tax=Geminocystis sp. NIES-3709 TaxID=1617448 RepID=UPI0005FC485D|nr:tetratricopeptide repeat protein [Geminocystis sp. NIES-3709]BAQ64300.1 TPR domain protein [Geminocystis sp. NIES-3709]
MSKYKLKILFLHTIPEQEKEWLKLLDSDEIILNIESLNTNITELFQSQQENQFTFPDLVLIDVSAKTPDGHFYQASSLSRWCKDNNISIHIFALNGQDEQISSFQQSWAKYQGLTGIFPKLNPDNSPRIISKLNEILGIKISPVVEEQSTIIPTMELQKTETEDIKNEPISVDTPILEQNAPLEDIKNDLISIDTPILEQNQPLEDIKNELISVEITTPIDEEILNDSLMEDVWVITAKTDLESLNKEIIKSPSSAELFCHRGDVYSSLGNDQDALNDYNMAIKLDSKFERAFQGRGHTLVRLGDYRNGIKDLTQVLKLNPQNPLAYHDRGLAMFRQGDERGARKDYDRAIKLKPDFSQAYNDRGFLQYLLGNTNQALLDYEQAIKYQPDYADAYYNRGNIYSDLGQFEEAIADYTEAIRYNPKFSLAYGNRGIAYYELDLVVEAINDTTKSANLFYEQGDIQSYQQAIETLKQMQ